MQHEYELKQKIMNTKLGIASKVKKIHDKKNPLDSVDLDYGSIRDYLKDTWTSLLDEGFVKSEEARRNIVYKLENPDVYHYEISKIDAIDQGKYSKVGFCSDVAEAQLDIVAKNKPIDDFNHLMDAMRYATEDFAKGDIFSFN